MTNATHVTVATFGILAGLAGIEHGLGEILQGNVAPDGVLILSWPDSAFFRILGGEPAMTLIPSFLASGLLTVVLSLVFAGWAALLAHRKHGSLVLLLLSLAMLLVGAGFGPPVLGLIVSFTASRIGEPRARKHVHPLGGTGHLLAQLWPWSYSAAIVAWLALMPGLSLLDYTIGATKPISDTVVYAVILSAFGFLLLTIVTGLAHDHKPMTRSPSRGLSLPDDRSRTTPFG
jgi:hypothetical protein